MLILSLEQIRERLTLAPLVPLMREALIAQSRGEFRTPLPMHLDISAVAGEAHIKASYRHGGRFFVVKVAETFPGNAARGLSSGDGLMLLFSAETGAPVVLLAEHGHLTDLRTAAVAAMAARELSRNDTALGILGTGIQARLQALLHAEVLPLRTIWVWGRSVQNMKRYREDLKQLLPQVEVRLAETPAEVAAAVRLITTVTASQKPLLRTADLAPGTHISAVGSDSPGKQELEPAILERAALLLVDSRAQCERLGELQHASHLGDKAVELGAFCEAPRPYPKDGITLCDFTGLGACDLAIAEHALASSTF